MFSWGFLLFACSFIVLLLTYITVGSVFFVCLIFFVENDAFGKNIVTLPFFSELLLRREDPHVLWDQPFVKA